MNMIKINSSKGTVLLALLSLRTISLTQPPHATPMYCIQSNQSNDFIWNTMRRGSVTELKLFCFGGINRNLAKSIFLLVSFYFTELGNESLW